MTSKGIGDVRRALGDAPTWAQLEFHPQQPGLPVRHADPLVNFVAGEILRLERQAVTEAAEYRNRDLGPAMVRYAHYLRDLLGGYRRVVGQYVAMLDAGADDHELAPLRRALTELAKTWRRSREWRDDW